MALTKEELALNNDARFRHVNKVTVRMIEDNVSGKEDANIIKFLFAWITYGPTFARKLPKVKTIEQNLKDMGFIRNNMLRIGSDNDDEFFLSFCLAISGAKRYISCTSEDN